MDKKFFENLRKSVRLQAREKDAIRESLLSYIEKHPVRKEMDLRLNTQTQRSMTESLSILNIFKLKPMTILVSLILMATLGLGGVSAAAENSLPGDALYPVKVGVNENIKSAVAFSQEGKADAEINKAERRLKEAEKLAVRGHFNEELKSRVDARFQNHIEKMTNIAAELEAQGNIEAASELRAKLDALLEVHEEILVKLEEQRALKAEAKALVKEVRSDLKQRIDDNHEIKIRVETKIKENVAPRVKSAAEGKLGAAENKLAEVEKFIDKKLGTDIDLDTATSSSVSAKLDGARNAIDQGKVKMETEQYGEAFLLFQKSMFLSQQAKMLVHAQIDLAEEDDDDNGNSTSTDSDNDEDEEEDDDEDGNSTTSGEADAEIETENAKVKSNGRFKINLGF